MVFSATPTFHSIKNLTVLSNFNYFSMMREKENEAKKKRGKERREKIREKRKEMGEDKKREKMREKKKNYYSRLPYALTC